MMKNKFMTGRAINRNLHAVSLGHYEVYKNGSLFAHKAPGRASVRHPNYMKNVDAAFVLAGRMIRKGVIKYIQIGSEIIEICDNSDNLVMYKLDKNETICQAICLALAKTFKWYDEGYSYV